MALNRSNSLEGILTEILAKQHCDFCGWEMPEERFVHGRRDGIKYCSQKCAGAASRRRVSARLQVAPRKMNDLDNRLNSVWD